MVYSNFKELISHVKKNQPVRTLAVAAAEDINTIEAVLMARDEGIIKPILIGSKNKIKEQLDKLEQSFPEQDIHDIADKIELSRYAVKLVREGRADFIMKGNVDTKVILKEVVNKEYGLNTGGTISSVTLIEMPSYHKLFAVVDGGIIPYPSLEQKRAIIENTVSSMLAMGYDCPKVAVLACAEKLNPKMPDMVEADQLKKMNQQGLIKNCIVEGPISYDCAIDKKIAEYKDYHSVVSGDVDIMVAPNIHAGNIMTKMISCSFGGKYASFVKGAACPIVLPSRGADTDEKYLSIVVCTASIN